MEIPATQTTPFKSDWVHCAGVGLFTLAAVVWMGHYLAHLMFTPF